MIKKECPNKAISEAMLSGARSRLVNVCYFALVTIGYLVMPILLVRVNQIGWNIAGYIHFTIVPLGSIIAFYYTKLSLKTRSILLILFTLLSAIGGLTTYGIVGSGFYGMATMAVVVGSITMGRTSGFLTLFISLIIYVFVMILVMTGKFSLASNLTQYAFSSTGWITSITGHVLYASLLIIGIQAMHKILKELIFAKINSSKEIEEKNIFLETVFNSAQTMLIVLDKNLNIIRFNKAVINNLDYNPEELKNKSFINLLSKEILKDKIKDIFDNNTSGISREDIFLKRNKEEIILNWDANFLPDNSWIISAMDITKDKIYEDKLIKAKEKAEESDRLKSAFLANMSHEIRTPMNSILGFLQLLKQPDLQSDKKDHYVEIVNKSAQRLLSTINDIIEISKIESGQSEINNSNVDLNEIMHSYFDLFQPKAIEKGIKLKISLAINDKDALILSDKYKIESILINLINNAIKFTSNGEIEIGNYLQDDKITIYVKDTGCGIPADRLDAVFDRFVQADINTNRSHQGSGLGLSIVEAYAKMLGGKVWLESEVDKGTTFYIEFPFIKGDNNSFNKNDKINILVADDSMDSCQLLEEMLTGIGHQVFCASSGEEAVRAVKENNDISMVIMDLQMPGINGLEATRHIREFNKSIPIIAQTAFRTSFSENIIYEAGCNEYLTRPFDKDDIINIIEKYTKN